MDGTGELVAVITWLFTSGCWPMQAKKFFDKIGNKEIVDQVFDSGIDGCIQMLLIASHALHVSDSPRRRASRKQKCISSPRLNST